ncbi:polyamine ABC transporter substrate-binding protein [Pseudomonas sp. dw_358]|uniref:polyamine ABC transporter substrate-binding protein n=1 Tax=Pseudomonas sp. dw_358 TaxID=2720083 RepID=UPI001BD243E7|nr:polyamine ABC transporter substrate-binding protein [Pseudomonas sp. dw_358]
MPRRLLAALLLAPCLGQAAETVKIYNWNQYIAPDTLANFQRDTGVHPTYETYDTNHTLDVRLRTHASGDDVVFPSIHFMTRQIQRKDLQPLDRQQLPNWKYLNPLLLHVLEKNDPGNRYGFPYLWGSTGIGYDRTKVRAVLGEEAPVDSWDLIFKPQYLSRLKQCGVGVIDSAAAMIPSALSYLGLSPNSTDPEDYAKAQALWLKARPYIRYFDSGKYTTDLANGRICVAIGYSGDVLQARATAGAQHNGIDIGYSVPREGSSLWFDMVAMPVNAPDPKAAYAYMNYLLQPKVIADITNHVEYANGNEGADEWVKPAIKDDPTIYPNNQLMGKLFTLDPLPQDIDQLRNSVWQKVRNGG